MGARGAAPERGALSRVTAGRRSRGAKYLNIFNFELGPKPGAFVNLILVDNLTFLFFVELFFGVF